MKKVILCAILAICLLTACQKNYAKEGVKYLEKKQYEEAKQAFYEAVDKKQNLDQAYMGLGMVYYEEQSYKQAKDSFDKVLENEGDVDFVFYHLMGAASMHVDDVKGALEAFEKGIRLAEDEKKGTSDKDYKDIVQEMKFNVVVCYEKLFDWDKAKEKIQEYTEQYPEDEEAQKEAEFLSTR